MHDNPSKNLIDTMKNLKIVHFANIYLLDKQKTN